MDDRQVLALRPIGRVVRGRPRPDRGGAWEEGIAEIEIEPDWSGALDGIEGFSHIWVVWWLDRFQEPPDTLRVHPERRQDLPLVGIFATRSPHRPNPIAMTAVRLLEHDGARLRVQGLDAYEGTCVIDIKPYLRRGDLIAEATMPHWLERLWRTHDQEKLETSSAEG
jgi:tRNA-Thr(GGU) m(6)t(6)A37 methyltransferase TsaA